MMIKQLKYPAVRLTRLLSSSLHEKNQILVDILIKILAKAKKYYLPNKVQN